jgi:sulfite exporter TauE/SafE
VIAIVVSGFALGIAGSLHCAGMCGPLVAIAGGVGRTRWSRVVAMLTQQAGRIAMYALLGWMAGRSGRLVADAGLRTALSVAGGATMIALAVAAIRDGRAAVPGAASRMMSAVLSVVRRRLPREGWLAPAALGALNGLLPCGLLYTALVGAAAIGGGGSAAVFMTAFGMGAVPALAAAASAMHLIPRRSAILRRAAPVAAALVGALLIIRSVAPAPAGAADHAHSHFAAR